VPTTTPPDSSFSGAASGCSDLFAYRENTDGTQFLIVQLDKTELALEPGTSRTFDLSRAPAGLRVAVDVFSRAPTSTPYCSDYVTDAIKPTSWEAEGGSLTVTLQPQTANGTYRATLRLRDLRFVGPERGVAASVPSATIENVLVGWLPG
jgi:hypothetical protein